MSSPQGSRCHLPYCTCSTFCISALLSGTRPADMLLCSVQKQRGARGAGAGTRPGGDCHSPTQPQVQQQRLTPPSSPGQGPPEFAEAPPGRGRGRGGCRTALRPLEGVRAPPAPARGGLGGCPGRDRARPPRTDTEAPSPPAPRASLPLASVGPPMGRVQGGRRGRPLCSPRPPIP